MVGADRDLHPCRPQNSRARGTRVRQFGLRACANQRPDNYRGLFFSKLIRDQMPLCAVDDHIAKPKFVCNPDRSKDVIGAVGMDMCLDPMVKQRQQRFTFGVVLRLIQFIVLCCFRKLLGIFLRLGELFPDQRGNRHPSRDNSFSDSPPSPF